MAIWRAPRPDTAFTQIRNDVLRDERLSYRARGILASILSRPDNWDTSSEALARAGVEGRDAIRTALAELEDAGYLCRERRQDDRGRWATASVVYDTPQDSGQAELFTPPKTDSQASVNQSSDSQASIEHGQEHSPNGEAAKPKAPQAVIADAVYEHAQGMVNYMAVRQVAGRALKITPAPPPEQVARIMCKLYDDGKPLILSTVGQALAKNAFKETNEDHWANGGGF